MAERERSVPENVTGSFFVDASCIDCDTCRQLAPATFAEAAEYSYVQMQPRAPGELRAAYQALVACPTGSIGADDKRESIRAVDDFPLPLAGGVSYCGFASPKSFGGSSYFVQHTAGNWLIDAPRYVERLARSLEQRGGIRYIFLTHRDDVADAARYARRFGAERIIHRLEIAAQPDAERVLEGFDPIQLAPGFLAIPTPGHTRGHCALLYGGEFLFAGDHLWWSRSLGRLNASRDVCWYSWSQQVASVALLEKYDFEWVLPGHGQRAHLAREEMAMQIRALSELLRGGRSLGSH